MRLILGLSIFVLILFGTCDSRHDICDTAEPVPSVTSFMLIDDSTGRSIIGHDRVFKPDSINVLNTYPPIQVGLGQDSIVRFNFGSVESGGTHLFNLSETDVDTIQIEYSLLEGDCFTVKKMEAFHYNSKWIEGSNGLYIIVK